jgi:hypothetical protein
MTIENEELDEQSLFNETVSDEPAETPEVPVAEIEQPEKPAGEVVAASDAPADKPVVDDNAPLIPSWRLREIREERDAVARRLADAEARLASQPAPKVEAPKVEKAARPDPLLDPDGYAAAIRQELREEALNDRREESLLKARESNQAEFDEAYAAAQKAVDPALNARMQSARDPGKTLLDWHRENKVKAEVGSDPNAWLEKKLEERLKDPAFLAKAVELARGSAQSQPSNGRPRVELPPSLSSQSRSSAAPKGGSEDVSDHELFEQITG